jgi:S1-C subfamily serine protease
LTRVGGGTSAETAGLRPGDRINELDGQPFADGTALRAAIHALLDAGRTEIPILIERRGHVRTVTLRIPSS